MAHRDLRSFGRPMRLEARSPVPALKSRSGEPPSVERTSFSEGTSRGGARPTRPDVAVSPGGETCHDGAGEWGTLMAADYPNIADHGLIGDLQTAALIDTNGTHRLVLRPALRFAQRLRVAARRRARRILQRAARDRRLRDAPALPAEHRHPRHPLHDRGRRGRADRLHAHRGGRGDRPPPARADAAGGARHDVVRGARSSPGSTTAGRRTGSCRPMATGAMFVSDDLSLTVHRVGDPVLHGTERAGHIELAGDGIRVTGSLERRRDGGRDARDRRRRAEAHLAGRDERDAPRDHAASGGTGTTARPTAAGGARWSPARR